MAFKGMNPVRVAIEAAVTRAGYRPMRIDGHEYIGGIMDEIIARIRESRFVVADLTHNRGGVYYEAGFAFGLGIPVIPTCRNDHLVSAGARTTTKRGPQVPREQTIALFKRWVSPVAASSAPGRVRCHRPAVLIGATVGFALPQNSSAAPRERSTEQDVPYR
jgi:hypothetical protein